MNDIKKLFKRNGKIQKNADPLIGRWTKEICPKCKEGHIMVNDAGSRWCTNIVCNYHIRNGKQAAYPPQYADVPNRYYKRPHVPKVYKSIKYADEC